MKYYIYNIYEYAPMHHNSKNNIKNVITIYRFDNTIVHIITSMIETLSINDNFKTQIYDQLLI